jgi:cyclopropane fatty-acyl-phospholipid synthase-like methyltransferase
MHNYNKKTSPAKWELFARNDPFWYICSKKYKSLDDFWNTGKNQAKEILYDIRGLLYNYNMCIEIGCGIGRLLFPMSSYFKECLGIDISETMLNLLEKYSKEYGLNGKIKGCRAGKCPCKADFIYSVWCFQHIESLDIIERYIKFISESLRERGVAYLQFNTQPQTLIYKIRNRVPDLLLPRPWRKGIRCIRRNRSVIFETLKKYDLSVIKEKNTNTANNIFILGKS